MLQSVALQKKKMKKKNCEEEEIKKLLTIKRRKSIRKRTEEVDEVGRKRGERGNG